MAAASAPARPKSTCAISARSATLVLVDGLRYVNGASASGVPGSIDLNTIPEGMIERVEVLQDRRILDLRLRRHRRRRQHHHTPRPGRFPRLGPARPQRRGRRLHPELPAELGLGNMRQRNLDRRRRQLYPSRRISARSAAIFRNSRPRARPSATRPAARAHRSAASSFSATI